MNEIEQTLDALKESNLQLFALIKAAKPFIALWDFADKPNRPDDMKLYEASGVPTLRLKHLRDLKKIISEGLK